MRRQSTRWKLVALVAFALGLTGGLPLRGQKQRQPATPPKKAVAHAFQVGETLDFQIGWASLMAATAQLKVNGRPPFYGREAWHFRALAKTVNTARLLYELDNQFDSYADPASLASFRYEAYLREQGKVENNITRMSGDGLPVQNDGPAVRVAAGTRDPLGLLYYLRTVNWKEQPQVKTQVFTGKRWLEIQANAVENGTVSVPAGQFRATRVQLHVFEKQKELDQVKMWVWIADGGNRAPALMEAEMPFGNLRIELTRTKLEGQAKSAD